MISFYINARNRVDLLVKTIRSLEQAAAFPVFLTIVDDASDVDLVPLLGKNHRLERLPYKMGAGEARKKAFELFLTTPHEVGFFLDSDLEFKPRFDEACLRALTMAWSPGAWVSPYRSSNHTSLDTPWIPGWVQGVTAGGATLVGRRHAVDVALSSVCDWGEEYDWSISRCCSGFIKPARSLVKHLGPDDPESLHYNSDDREVL